MKIALIGAGGKMGPTLARMARRAVDEAGVARRVIAVSRFHSTETRRNLEAAGVDSVPELAQRNAENLATKIAEVNEAKKLVGRAPSANEVGAWIIEAKSLPRVVEH